MIIHCLYCGGNILLEYDGDIHRTVLKCLQCSRQVEENKNEIRMSVTKQPRRLAGAQFNFKLPIIIRRRKDEEIKK
jgi:DNA-directed RNA polymerase subunit RPC12/RpoP